MIENYFNYQKRLGLEVLLPTLRARNVPLAGARVLDVGCGQGGVLAALAEAETGIRVEGLDLDPSAIAAARAAKIPDADFRVGDFLNDKGNKVDFVLVRDALEHIRHPSIALEAVRSRLAPGGWLYMSYSPFGSPFGGHQHNAEGIFSRLPWIHLLPESWFRKLLVIRGNAYKGKKELDEDMESVLATRLSLNGCRKMIESAGLKVKWRKRWLVRPDYRIKFGLAPIPLPAWLPDTMAEYFCTAEELLLCLPEDWNNLP